MTCHLSCVIPCKKNMALSKLKLIIKNMQNHANHKNHKIIISGQQSINSYVRIDRKNKRKEQNYNNEKPLFLKICLIYEILKLLEVMAECPHGTPVKKFCYKQKCTNPTVGGCNLCFMSSSTQKHSHHLMDIEDLQQILKKFTFPKRVKPQCTVLQKAYFEYYQKMKEQLDELPNAVDIILKTMVNKIGFPYIYSNNHFKTFKRIKNQDFDRINPEQFYHFVKETRDIQSSQITNEEQKIYLQTTQNFYQLISDTHKAMETFQTVLNSCTNLSKFKHDKEPYEKICGIMEKIANSQKKIAGNTAKLAETSDQPRQREKDLQASDIKRNKQPKKPSSLNIKKIWQKNNLANLKNYKDKDYQQSLQGSFNLSKQKQIKKTEQKGLIPGQNQKRRRNSLEKQLFKINKLEEKADYLKKKSKQPISQQNQLEQTPPCSREIKNHEIPEEQPNIKESRVLERYEVKPVKRKLEGNYINFHAEEEVESPLLKKKLKHANSIKSSKSSNTNSPFMIESPQQPQGKTGRQTTQKFAISPHQVLNTDLPPLSCNQQNSFLLLTASFKLQTKQAIPILQKALFECQQNISAAQYLSFLYIEDKQPKKCLSLCNNYLQKIAQNVELDSSNQLLTNNKGASLNLLGRYSEAVKLLEGLPTKNQNTLKGLGNAHYSLGFYDQAIFYYKQIEQNCHDDEVLYNLSGCLYLKQNFAQAKVAIHSALVLVPKKQDYLDLQAHIFKKLRSNK